MSTVRLVYSMIGPLLLTFVVVASIGGRLHLPRHYVTAIALVAALGVLVPVGGTTGLSVLLGLFDTLSATTAVLLAIAAASVMFPSAAYVASMRDRLTLAAALVLSGLVLYPSALGFLYLDTYAAGYGGWVLPAALGALLAYAAYGGLVLTPAVVGAALLAWHLALGESTNLWDYLIDPVAVVIALIAVRR